MLKKLIKDGLSRFGYELINKKTVSQLHFDIDPGFHDLYELAQQKCQMTDSDNALRRQRHYTLNHLLRNANIGQGDVCEIGCWRGLSVYQSAHYLKSTNKNVKFHVFDSFEGLSPYEKVDIVEGVKQDLEQRRKQFACSLDVVKENLKEFDFIEYYKGWVPEKFPEVEDVKFSFVHIDVDLYQPIYDSFQFFYPRMVDKGVMVFDDYGYTLFPGAKKAVDECLKKFGNPFFIPLPSGQAFLIKNL